jgi:hypothetical protein
LQAFWPLQDDEPILQALWPLHALTPLHFTPAACAAVASVLAAKMAAAVANTVRLVMSQSPLIVGATATHRCDRRNLHPVYADCQVTDQLWAVTLW